MSSTMIFGQRWGFDSVPTPPTFSEVKRKLSGCVRSMTISNILSWDACKHEFVPLPIGGYWKAAYDLDRSHEWWQIAALFPCGVMPPHELMLDKVYEQFRSNVSIHQCFLLGGRFCHGQFFLTPCKFMVSACAEDRLHPNHIEKVEEPTGHRATVRSSKQPVCDSCFIAGGRLDELREKPPRRPTRSMRPW
jgi:hypothetical protein